MKELIFVSSVQKEFVGVTRKMAMRDLDRLVEKGVLQRKGAKRGAHYVLAGRKSGMGQL